MIVKRAPNRSRAGEREGMAFPSSSSFLLLPFLSSAFLEGDLSPRRGALAASASSSSSSSFSSPSAAPRFDTPPFSSLELSGGLREEREIVVVADTAKDGEEDKVKEEEEALADASDGESAGDDDDKDTDSDAAE